MRPHENLEAWVKAVDFVVDIYRASDSFPKDEKFGLVSQVRRAAVSVPANIAEGAARQSDKEFLHFLSIAQGSASELETELIIACRPGYLEETKYKSLIESLQRVGRLITGLSQHLKRRIK